MIRVMNRERAERVYPEPGTVAISFYTPTKNDPAKLSEQFDDKLVIGCWDCSPDEPGADYLFTSMDARQVFNFANKHSNKDFVIHCDAGFSRSVAVGRFLSSWLGVKVVYMETGHDEFANNHILNTLNRVAWIEGKND